MIANSPLPPSRRAASSVSVLPMPSGVAWLTKKSRASGSASASHVSTLMPRSRALRSTVEMPARFSTATAMTSTLRVIQFSTTSFCFAASSPVGPSQMSSTPSSCAASSAPARQLTKYGSPFAFGIIAITRRGPAGSAGPTPCLPTRAPPAPRGHDRAHEPHVGARHDERGGDDRRADDGYLTVLHLKVSVGQCRGLGSAARAAGAARAPRIYVNRDRGEEKDPGQHAGQLRRQRRQPQAVAEHRQARRDRAACPRACRARRTPTSRRGRRP